GYQMARIAAATLAGEDACFSGADMSTKLKLLGVDVASFGDAQPPLLNIDFIDRLARPQAHPVPGVPLRRQQRDLRRRFFT
ncbi:hypothetical protein, partial [Klebsiella pneumoniae]|uniref:hypothetical protein n=1 Tax=Klebsiella pneumoniae TaxID=573 RepID=UPI0030DCDE81